MYWILCDSIYEKKFHLFLSTQFSVHTSDPIQPSPGILTSHSTKEDKHYQNWYLQWSCNYCRNQLLHREIEKLHVTILDTKVFFIVLLRCTGSVCLLFGWVKKEKREIMKRCLKTLIHAERRGSEDRLECERSLNSLLLLHYFLCSRRVTLQRNKLVCLFHCNVEER